MEGTVCFLFFALTCLEDFSAAPLGVNVSSIAPISPNTTFVGLATTAPVDAIFPPLPELDFLPSVSCPDKLRICWQDNPPYFIKSNFTGVFKDVIQDVLTTCCGAEALPELDFVHEAGDDEGLRNCTSYLSDDFDLILPIRSKLLAQNTPGKFINVVQSPGIALVLNREKLVKEARKNGWNEMLKILPVLALALLLAAIFGIVVWALDNSSNPDTFSPQFPQGATEGIWWAFVTMTTVGYGDKTPKNLLARIFAIVWMFIGVSLVSLCTATMTSALTSGKVGNTADVFNKKIGVLDGAQGYEEGIKQGADVQKYKTLDELYQALMDKNLDGIMLDVFKASYSANHILESDENLVLAKIFEFPFILGFHVSTPRLPNGNKEHLTKQLPCIKTVSSKSFESEVYHTVRKYVQGAALKDLDREASGSKSGSWQTKLNMFSTEAVFYRYLRILGSILGGLILLGSIYEIVKWCRRETRALNNPRGTDAAHKLNTLEFRRMRKNLSELEKSLAKISEFKEFYHKLETDTKPLECDKNGSMAATVTHV